MFNRKYKEFIRVFLYKNGLNCIHIKEDVIVDKYQCDFEDKNKFSNGNTCKLPIELIVNHRSMICNSLVTKELSNKEVNNLVHNTIEKNTVSNNQLNTIFYSVVNDKKSNSKILYTCECELSKEMLNVIKLLNNKYNACSYINNSTISTTVFPIWVTYNFIKMYYNNTYEFSTNVFVIEYLDCWNIIVINDNKIIYNRSGLLTSFKKINSGNTDARTTEIKHTELTNTLHHIKNTYNIDIDDIIIYEFGGETIDSLTKYYKGNMKMISNTDDSEGKVSCINNNTFIKVACLSCIAINCSFLCYNFYNMHKVLLNKNSCINYINNCNKNIINDFSIWNKLHNIYYYLKDINYKKVLHNYLNENYNTNHTDTINSLHMYLDNNNVLCNINV